MTKGQLKKILQGLGDIADDTEVIVKTAAGSAVLLKGGTFEIDGGHSAFTLDAGDNWAGTGTAQKIILLQD